MASRRQVPVPPSMPPSSKAKDYSDRPSELLDELDELRNRGIAKLLNRHFTDTTKRLAVEKAAADAALADLERRRANTSEFVPSKGGDLNPFDSMYVELQQKRAECRRKERETMLLYQRYVHKYKKSAKLAAPVISPPFEERSAGSPTNAAPPPPSPVPGKSPPLQPLDEHSETAVNEGINFSKFYNRQLSERGRDAPSLSSSKSDAEGKKVESNGETITRLVVPELRVSEEGLKISKDAPGATDPPERVEEDAERNWSQDDELRSVKTADTSKAGKEDPPAVKFVEPEPAPMPEKENLDPQARVPPPADKNEFVVDSEQPKAADKIESSSIVTDGNLPTTEVTTEMPTATTATDGDIDDRSIISGLTMNSQVTRQVLDEIETEMDEFIRAETEAIRKMLDEEESEINHSLSSSFANNSGSSMVGDESILVAAKAEAMAREMQKILHEYTKEDSSYSQRTSLGGDEDESIVSTKYPRKYETTDPSENWTVYYDETYQREYYYEKNTGQTLWEPPSSRKKKASHKMLTEDFRPESTMGVVRAQSRRNIYRKRLRKRRIRRAITVFFALGVLGVSILHWKMNHPDKTYPEAMEVTLTTTSSFVSEGWKASSKFVQDQFDSMFVDRAAEEEAKRLELERLEKERLQREVERRAREKAELKAKEEAERKAKEEAERRAREEAKRIEEVARRREEEIAARRRAEEEARMREIERQTKVEEEARLRQEAEKRAAEEREARRRPVGCYIPLASHIIPRCRKVANINPIYKETDLLNNFLQ